MVRHAIAHERGSAYPDDALRPLTPEGRAKMAEAAAGLAKLFRPEVILTSPLVRARETADIVREACGAPPAKELDALASGDHRALVAAANETGALRVMAVGHQPWMSELLSYLLAGESHAMVGEFKKGAAALVSAEQRLEPGACLLAWLLQPAALRAMAAAR
jgi:phosphohistidine phosphatase